MLAIRTPAVTDVCLLPATPCPIWHCTDESDSHLLLSHALWPCLEPNENNASPKPEPCNVTTDDPVVGTLLRAPTLSRPDSSEKLALKLLTRNPADISAR